MKCPKCKKFRKSETIIGWSENVQMFECPQHGKFLNFYSMSRDVEGGGTIVCDIYSVTDEVFHKIRLDKDVKPSELRTWGGRTFITRESHPAD